MSFINVFLNPQGWNLLILCVPLKELLGTLMQVRVSQNRGAMEATLIKEI